jgi:iron complex transport system ATP-binding protein
MPYQIKNISFSYGEKIILREISATIQDGEFLGLLGPNGCGKTTLIKLLSGVLKPNSGMVQFMGKDLKTYSRNEIARHVAVLPQDNLIDFPFTALEVALMGRSPYLGNFRWEGPQDLAIVREAMEQTDCWHLAGQDIRSLSGGERERVLLARALSQRPKVLLLDEPTTHLDLQHQRETYRLLQRLHRENKLTLVVALHDLNFAAQSCDRLLLLKDQQIQALGNPEDVLKVDKITEVFGVPVQVQKFESEKRPWIRPEW